MTDLEVGHSGVFKEQQRCRCSRRGNRRLPGWEMDCRGVFKDVSFE